MRQELPKTCPDGSAARKPGRAARCSGPAGQNCQFGFEPGDIVTRSCLAHPVEIVVASPNLGNARAHATKILDEMKKIPSCATSSSSRA